MCVLWSTLLSLFTLAIPINPFSWTPSRIVWCGLFGLFLVGAVVVLGYLKSMIECETRRRSQFCALISTISKVSGWCCVNFSAFRKRKEACAGEKMVWINAKHCNKLIKIGLISRQSLLFWASNYENEIWESKKITFKNCSTTRMKSNSTRNGETRTGLTLSIINSFNYNVPPVCV